MVDMNTTASRILSSADATKLEPTESSEESLIKDAGKIMNCPNILHTGKDGKKRMICGPGIGAAKMGAHQAGYLDYKLMHGCVTSLVRAPAQGNMRESGLIYREKNNQQKPCEPRPYIKPICQFGLINKKKLDPFQEVYAHHGKKPEVMEEPVRAKVHPNFRTPPGWIRIGTIVLHV